MDVAISVFVFVLGTIIGSFLNVVVMRFHAGSSITKGRSICFSCGRTLRWYELIPVASFFLQRGRCRTCGARISRQYVIVEVVAGTLFLAAFLSAPSPVAFGYFAAVSSILLVIAVYDIRHKIIPDPFVYAFIVLSGAALLIETRVVGLASFPALWDVLAGPVLFLPFAALWLLSRGRWIGLGDAKLAWGIGWFLGASKGIVAVILSFWIGAIVSMLLIGLARISGLFQTRKRFTIKSEVAFGPFLIIALALVWWFGIDAETFFSAFVI